MNINYFLSLVSISLISIYFLFKPMDIKQVDNKEVPLFSIDKFTLHELDEDGLITLMYGTKAKRYSNRYDVSNIDYTDNSKEFTSNMKANHGLYKENIVYLDGDVEFDRKDGLRYFSQKAVYNKKTEVASTNVDFNATMGLSKLYGTSIVINNNKNTIKSKDIYAIYNFKENR